MGARLRLPVGPGWSPDRAGLLQGTCLRRAVVQPVAVFERSGLFADRVDAHHFAHDPATSGSARLPAIRSGRGAPVRESAWWRCVEMVVEVIFESRS
jgi:hypothetical protein